MFFASFFSLLTQQCVVFQSWISVSTEDLVSVMNFEPRIIYAFNYTEACHRISSSVLACQVYCHGYVYIYYSCIKQFFPSDISRFLFSLVQGIFRGTACELHSVYF